MKYYSLREILKKKATYNVIIGERSNGKTYSVLKYSVQKYVKTGGQIAIVRRWREDVIGRRASGIFSALNADGTIKKITNSEFSEVYYYAGKFYLSNIDENGKHVYSDENCIGYTFALSENEHNKSISYPKVTTIFFDEFLTKHIYLADEFVLFMNTLSTIIRQRDNVEIFMCGNTVNKYSPYFAEMGLSHIQKQKQGTIDVYSYGDSNLKVAVEYCASLAKQKKNNFYFAFDNPKLNMIKSGVWELGIFPHLPKKYNNRQILFTYFIIFEQQTFQCEIIDYKNGNLITFIHLKTSEIKDKNHDLVYTLDDSEKMNYNKNILKPATSIGEKIKWFFTHEKVFFQNNDVGNTVTNYLKICGGI